jgi:hypothetical protein
MDIRKCELQFKPEKLSKLFELDQNSKTLKKRSKTKTFSIVATNTIPE